MKTPPCFEDPEAKKVIRQLCQQHRVDTELAKDLCELIQDHSGSGRRFGCWACTVVEKDNSLESQICAGHDHLTPLADYGCLLAA